MEISEPDVRCWSASSNRNLIRRARLSNLAVKTLAAQALEGVLPVSPDVIASIAGAIIAEVDSASCPSRSTLIIHL